MVHVFAPNIVPPFCKTILRGPAERAAAKDGCFLMFTSLASPHFYYAKLNSAIATER